MSIPILSPHVQRIAKEIEEDPDRVYTNLAHLIDVGLLEEAFWHLRRNAAAGVDRVTWRDYMEDLGGHLKDLHQRLKEQRYKAQPVKRVSIDKEDGKQRQLGISALEDKIRVSRVSQS